MSDDSDDCDGRILEAIAHWMKVSPSISMDKEKPPADGIEKLERFSKGARQLIVATQKLADDLHHTEISVVHFFATALASTQIQAEFSTAGADPIAALAAAKTELESFAKATTPSYLGARLMDMLRRARREAGMAEVSIEHLLHAAITVPVRTLRDLNRDGLEQSAEHNCLLRVLGAGRLQRLWPPSN